MYNNSEYPTIKNKITVLTFVFFYFPLVQLIQHFRAGNKLTVSTENITFF